MNIKMPSPEERRRSINTIIKAALPEKRTLMGEIKRLFRTVGLKNAFCGVGDAVAAALMMSFGILLTISIYIVEGGSLIDISSYNLAPVLFFAPILYFTILALTSWKERMSGTWEVLASCRYNLKHITAIRAIIVSLAGMVFIPITTLPFIGTPVYWNVLTMSFCSIFLYSTFTLLSLLVSESLISQFSVPVLWSLFWSVMILTSGFEGAGKLLSGIPLWVSGAAAIIIFIMFFAEFQVLVMRSTKRTNYA